MRKGWHFPSFCVKIIQVFLKLNKKFACLDQGSFQFYCVPEPKGTGMELLHIVPRLFGVLV